MTWILNAVGFLSFFFSSVVCITNSFTDAVYLRNDRWVLSRGPRAINRAILIVGTPTTNTSQLKILSLVHGVAIHGSSL